MKSLGGIGAIILGVVAILVSIGLQTIWAPPAEFNATTHDTQEAPLTIVTDGIDVDPDDSIEYTVTGQGEFTLMYGQMRDIEAWVGDTAHNRINGVDTDVERGEDPIVEVTYVDGQTEAPSPVNSDLWVATQDVTDEVTQRWTRTDAGEWGLLIAVDGTEPAPTDVSVSWVNVQPDSPWIMPLLIVGIVLILVGIGLLIWRFIEFRRRAKRTSGRRAAVRGDYTGVTAADVRADADGTQHTATLQQVDAGEPVVSSYNTDDSVHIVGEDEDDHLDDDDDLGGSTAARGYAAEPPAEDPDDTQRGNGFLRRTSTILTALGLTAGLSIGPAHADSTEDIDEQVEQQDLDEDIESEDQDTVPVVLDAQLERILDDIAADVQRSDDDLDPEALTDRVASQALRVREDFYRNKGIEEDYPERVPISSDEILSAWMERDDAFPRTVYAITTDDEETATQLLVLQQQDARSQYQLVSNAPFIPGEEVPAGDLGDAQVEAIARDESAGLVMSPDEAIEALAEYLTDPEADAAIADNDWIDQIHEYQQETAEQHGELDTEVNISRTVFDDSVTAVQLQDDSALVFGAMNSLESLTPDEGAMVNLNPTTEELGNFETDEADEQVKIRYREQFALHIPAEGEVSLVGYETVQSTVD